MSRPVSPRMAGKIAEKPGSGVTLEPGATGDGLHEWFASLGPLDITCAAFDTRGGGLGVLTGRASKRIHRLLRRHGARPVRRPHSFRMGPHNTIAPGELLGAEQWGAELARASRASAHV